MGAPVEGGMLYYEAVGTGPLVLLMHGGPGLDQTVFRPWLDPLADSHTLVFYDQRGQGRSSRPADWSTITNRTFADDAEALRRHLRIDSVLVLGHSYGAAIALEFARAYPDRVSGLALCGAFPALDYPETAFANAAARATPAELDAATRLFSPPLRDDAEFGALTRATLPIYFHRYEHARHGSLFDNVCFSAAAYDHGMLSLAPSYNALPWLAQIQAPTLVLAGADDWLCPRAQGADRLLAGLPNAQLVEFSASGHYPFVEENTAFIEAFSYWSASFPR